MGIKTATVHEMFKIYVGTFSRKIRRFKHCLRFCISLHEFPTWVNDNLGFSDPLNDAEIPFTRLPIFQLVPRVFKAIEGRVYQQISFSWA